MPSAATWIHGQSSTFLHHFQLSASLDEKITLMVEFTSMLLSISADSIQLEMLVSLMWTDATRMCSLARKHRRRCTIMQSKMATLLQGDSSDQTEGEFLRLATRGLRSSWLRLETSFSDYVDNWLRDISPQASQVFANMPTGPIEWTEHPIRRLRDTYSTLVDFRNSMIGYEAICWDVRLDDVASLSC
jgi:hypothetical protein